MGGLQGLTRACTHKFAGANNLWESALPRKRRSATAVQYVVTSQQETPALQKTRGNTEALPPALQEWLGTRSPLNPLRAAPFLPRRPSYSVVREPPQGCAESPSERIGSRRVQRHTRRMHDGRLRSDW